MFESAGSCQDDGEAAVPVMVLLDSIHRPGGGETLAIEGIVRIDPKRFRRTLCLTRWDDAFLGQEPARSILARLDDAGVRVLGIRRSGRWALAPMAGLARRIRRERTAVVHGHLFGSNFWAAVLGTLARTPAVVAHEHMWAYSGSRLRSLIDRFVIARLSDAFVAVSRYGLQQMIEVERIPERDVVLIENGGPSRGTGDGARLRRELGIGPGEVVIGSVGHLRPEKAFEVLIEAAALLKVDGKAVRVVIAGEGPERDLLERLAGSLGIAGEVLLIGARSDVADVLAAFDVAICCSDFEGGPLSVIEYMEAGLPVVATDVGGMSEMIEGGRSGLFVGARDAPGLAAAVSGLLDDPELRGSLGRRGREIWVERYNIEVWVERIEDLYERLLATART